jgi:hypothetical protein
MSIMIIIMILFNMNIFNLLFIVSLQIAYVSFLGAIEVIKDDDGGVLEQEEEGKPQRMITCR